MRVLFGLFIGFFATSCLAQSIHAYKSVHTDGAVSYSDTRPTDAESVTEVKVYHESAAIEQQGSQRMQEMNAATKAGEKQRAEEADARRKHDSRVAAARQEVTDAERHLVTAQQSKRHATPERIAAAQERLGLAKQGLREAQRAGP